MRVSVAAVRAVHMCRRVRVAMMRMVMPAVGAMNVRMTMFMIVVMRMSMVLMENLLRERIVFRERRVVAVFVSATVGTRFRLEGHQRFGHVDIQSQQHVAQYRIGFELEIPVANFDRRVTIAEVIRRPSERERRRRRHQQHRFRRGFHANQSTVICHKHIATA